MGRSHLSVTAGEVSKLRKYSNHLPVDERSLLRTNPHSRRLLCMRYYFDLRLGDELAVDEEGIELASLQRVQEEAARSLADMARDTSLQERGNGPGIQMVVEVRDENGPVLQARFEFVIELQKSLGN